MSRNLNVFMSVALLITACGTVPGRFAVSPMGRMMSNPFSVVPYEYAGLYNPIPDSPDSVARGAETYEIYCATCHGKAGHGDGPASSGIDPAPAPLAFWEHMRSDAYLFYRISEGGNFTPFNSAMLTFKEILDEDQRWDVINYVRSLGGGMMMPWR